MMELYGTNAGHGHVWERPDGIKARCGGPGICSECSRYAAVLASERDKPSKMTDPTDEEIDRVWDEMSRYADARTQARAAIAAIRAMDREKAMPDVPQLPANWWLAYDLKPNDSGNGWELVRRIPWTTGVSGT